MPEVHARLSPSASGRWLSCPASIRLSEYAPVSNKPSKYAEEGTAVHKLIEDSIKNHDYPTNFIGKTVLDVVITDKMADNAAFFVDYFRAIAKDADIAESEMWVDLTFLGVEGLDGGTADAVIIKDDILYIMDYKNGSGVKVDSKMNTQLMCYSVGLLNKYPEIHNIHMVIIQPNVSREINDWEIHDTELIFWRDYYLIPRANLCHDINAPCIPSEKACKFCPACGICKAHYYNVSRVAISDFAAESDEVLMPSVNYLNNEQKARIVRYSDMIRNFLQAVADNVREDMLSGNKYPGLKLVRKDTRRRLREDALDDVMSPLWDVLTEDDVYVRKPRALSEIESAIKKSSDKKTAKQLMDIITDKPEGDIIVVSADDRRKEVNVLLSEFVEGDNSDVR